MIRTLFHDSVNTKHERIFVLACTTSLLEIFTPPIRKNRRGVFVLILLYKLFSGCTQSELRISRLRQTLIILAVVCRSFSPRSTLVFLLFHISFLPLHCFLLPRHKSFAQTNVPILSFPRGSIHFGCRAVFRRSWFPVTWFRFKMSFRDIQALGLFAQSPASTGE